MNVELKKINWGKEVYTTITPIIYILIGFGIFYKIAKEKDINK